MPEDLREGDKIILSSLDYWYEQHPDIVIKWIESLDYIHKDEAYDYICENAEGRCDR